MADQSPPQDAPAGGVEHLNIKVTDNNNEVFFKIKRTTQLKKLMDAFCDRQGKMPSTVRFLLDGERVNPTDTPDSVSHTAIPVDCKSCTAAWPARQLHKVSQPFGIVHLR